MRTALLLTRRHVHLLAALVALATVGTLYMGAHALGGDLGMVGLSDDQVRTVGHFVAFGSLGVVLAIALRWRYALAWLIAVVIGAIDELRQMTMPDRYADLGDWAVDVAGITVFILIAAAVQIFLISPAPTDRR